PTRGAGLASVLCPSATACTGLGGYHVLHGPSVRQFRLILRDGTWTPDDRYPPLLGLYDFACPSITSCVGVTNHGPGVSLVSESGTTWRKTPLALPGSPADSSIDISALACGGPVECVAFGSYRPQGGPSHAFLVSDHAGTWERPVLLRVEFSSVACAAPGECTALGSKSAGHGALFPWVMSEHGGQWGHAQFLALPADASSARDSRGKSPFMGFSGLACPSPGNCTAAGGYVDRRHDFEGVLFTERNGRWLPGVKAPAPADALPWTDGNELVDPLGAVACGAPDDCSVLGSYVKDASGYTRAMLLSEHDGRWTAIVPSLPSSAPGGVALTGVECPSRGECVVVGWYSTGHDTPGQYGDATFGLVLLERHGLWEHGFAAAVPRNAAGSAGSHTLLDSVVCQTPRLCRIDGSYVDKEGAALKPGPPGPPQRAFLLTLRLG